MKNIIKAVVVLGWFALGAIIGQSQSFSNSKDGLDAWMASAKIVKTSQPEKFVTKFTITLFTADAVARSLDGYSTIKNLSNPCRCFHESNPIAPKGSSVAAEAGFQAGAMAISWGTAYLLNKYHHPKMARAVLMFEVGSEGVYAGHNFAISGNRPVRGTPLQHLSLGMGAK